MESQHRFKPYPDDIITKTQFSVTLAYRVTPDNDSAARSETLAVVESVNTQT